MFEIGYGDGGAIAFTGRLDAAQSGKAQAFLDTADASLPFDLPEPSLMPL